MARFRAASIGLLASECLIGSIACVRPVPQVPVATATEQDPCLPQSLKPPALERPPAGTVRNVVLVGNNWDGTAVIFDPTTFQRIAEIDVVPDRKERMAEINASWRRKSAAAAIRRLAGEG